MRCAGLFPLQTDKNRPNLLRFDFGVELKTNIENAPSKKFQRLTRDITITGCQISEIFELVLLLTCPASVPKIVVSCRLDIPPPLVSQSIDIRVLPSPVAEGLENQLENLEAKQTFRNFSQHLSGSDKKSVKTTQLQ